MRANRRRRTTAMIAALGLLGGLLAGSLAITPAGAHVDSPKHLWDGHLFKLAKQDFFTKDQMKKRIPRAHGTARDWPAVPTLSIPAGEMATLLTRNLTAPKKGAYLANYSAWLESGGTNWGITWMEMDTEAATRCTSGYTGTNHVPGTTTFTDFVSGISEGNNAGTAVIPVSPGPHVLALCIQNATSSTLTIPDASLTALFVNSGKNSLVTAPAGSSSGSQGTATGGN